jgi:hypothetical protein
MVVMMRGADPEEGTDAAIATKNSVALTELTV